jgi:large subunit ribosomal protein L5
MEPKLKILYKDKVIPNLMKEFEYKNIHQVPKLKKLKLTAV